MGPLFKGLKKELKYYSERLNKHNSFCSVVFQNVYLKLPQVLIYNIPLANENI